MSENASDEPPKEEPEASNNPDQPEKPPESEVKASDATEAEAKEQDISASADLTEDESSSREKPPSGPTEDAPSDTGSADKEDSPEAEGPADTKVTEEDTVDSSEKDEAKEKESANIDSTTDANREEDDKRELSATKKKVTIEPGAKPDEDEYIDLANAKGVPGMSQRKQSTSWKKKQQTKSTEISLNTDVKIPDSETTSESVTTSTEDDEQVENAEEKQEQEQQEQEQEGEQEKQGAEGAVDSRPAEAAGGDTAPDQEGKPEQKTEVDQPPAEEKKEEEKEAEEEEEEEQVFDYDYEVMKSTSTVVNTSIPNILQLHHSFGYECHKRFNLVVLAKEVVAYAAGNMIIILNLDTHQQTCYRSLGGGGIGAIAAHPSQGYFAVGEKGEDPVIAIYTYPEFSLHRILRGGTQAMYSHMDFSPGDGKLLASVGGDPDFMLTVWDWMKEKIVLRYKAFSQDIYRVTFSPENAEQLTTSGTGHIRFWKMASTFTGLKLQGQLGKFGRIEISDISAYVELPDGKVLSGTEWGNFLLWDGGFIKVELSKKGKKFCHNGMIEAIYLDEGELISAGVDGYIRVRQQ